MARSKVSAVLLGSLILLADNCHGGDSLQIVIILQGETNNEHLGKSMRGVGDVNGDGLTDFLVGDAREGWLPGERRCFLYFGKPHMEIFPDIVICQSEADTMEPHSDDDCHFGEVVSGGRDVNGDGFEDILITSPWWFLSTGKVYLYCGGSPMELDPEIAIAGYGSSWMTMFWATELRGSVVEDVNGDGFDELACVVGWPTPDAGVYVYFGGAPIDSVHDIGLQGPGYPGFELGSDVADGDVNGDGYGDIVVGAYPVGNVSQVQHAAWIYFGGADMDEIADVKLAPAQATFEHVVCVPGDLNCDGYDDVAVGSLYSYSENHPKVFVFFGGAQMDSIADLTLTGRFLWASISLTGGDLNGDGSADLVISEQAYLPDEGRVAIYMGGADMDTMPDIEIYKPGRFGETLAWIGDMTGDGWPEFAVSNPSGAGEIYIYTMGEVQAGETPVLPRMGELRIVPNPSRGPTMIGFDGEVMSGATVGVYDLGGHLVHRLGSAGQRNEVSWLLWDGTNGSGQAVPAGIYVIRVQAQDRVMSGNVVVNR